MSWPTLPPSTDPSTYYQSLTPDQQLANWTQWQNYQQQYAAWHAQYGAEYARQMQTMTSAPPPISSTATAYPYPTGSQPPLPPGNPPPLTDNLSSGENPPLPLANSINDYGTLQIVPSTQLREYQTVPVQQKQSEYMKENFSSQLSSQQFSMQSNQAYQKPSEFQHCSNQNQIYWHKKTQKPAISQNQFNHMENDNNNRMGRNRWSNKEDYNITKNKHLDHGNQGEGDGISNNRNGQFNRGSNKIEKRNSRGDFEAGTNEGACNHRFDQRVNENQEHTFSVRGSIEHQKQPISLMSLNFNREDALNETSRSKSDHQQEVRANNGRQAMDPNELTEEEKQFEIQFKKWESEFEKWKQQNAKHPDRNAYREYEKRFEECRTKLVARREQMRQKKLERIRLLDVKTEIKEESENYIGEVLVENINEQVERNTMNVANIFNSNTGFGIPGLDLTASENPSKEDSSAIIKENNSIDLTNEILNTTPSSNIAESISKLIENPQVLALLSLVGLSKATPTQTQTEALKPITDALSKITGRNARDIMVGLQKASIDGLKVFPNQEKIPEVLVSRPSSDTNVHIAQSGIVVTPPTYFAQQSFYPSHNQWEMSWSQQHHNPNSQNQFVKPSQPLNNSTSFDASSVEENDDFFQPATVIDYAQQNIAENFNAVNIVDYQHGEFSFKGDKYFNIKKSFNYGHESSKRKKTDDKPYYGESNPTYPSRWILISERPPLTKRTKRGKRKNRKGKIIESKKSAKNQQEEGDFFKPTKVIDYALANDNLQREISNPQKTKSCTSALVESCTLKQGEMKMTEKKTGPQCEIYPPTESLQYHKNVLSLDDILLDPGRATRPEKICVILRGPPGSGKSCLAKIIKDQELAISGTSPRVLSIDDYYSIEKEVDEVDPRTGKTVKVNVMVYEYDPFKERTYVGFLLKNYKKTILDGLYNFIIIDTWNDQLKDYEEFYNFAKQHGYSPYTIELLYPLNICMKHNEHKRLSYDIRTMISNWSKLPPSHVLLDATNLIQFSMSQPESQEIVAENVETPMDSIEIDLASEKHDECNTEDIESGYFRSKWEAEATEDKLAKLDGITRPIKNQTIEDYLQIDGWEPSTPLTDGKKRVRWADIETRKEQIRKKALGFVVGQTDWTNILDSAKEDSALIKVKYIDKVDK